jgi:hypothetical protein
VQKYRYNVTSTSSAYAWLPIDTVDSGNKDLSGWDTVWIVIRGQSGGEEISAEFAECENPAYPKVRISDFLVGDITTTWRAAAIPFEAFNPISDWSCIDRFSLIAHNEISSGVGEVHVDEIRLLPSTVYIDDYHDQDRENELGGDSGIWPSDPPRFITPTFTTVDGNETLKLSYNVPPTGSSSYWTGLRATNLLSQKEGLFFEVKGEQGREEVLVEFPDCGINGYSHYPKTKISDYLVDGITTEWRTVAIPLVAFVEVQADADPGVDWNCSYSFNFYVSGEERYDSGQGIIFVDNVRLVPGTSSHTLRIVVDRFTDCNQWNALDGQWFTGTYETDAFTPTLDPAANHLGSYGCGYRITHKVNWGESAWLWTELKALDVSGYDYLQFYIRGKEENEYMYVKLEDRDALTETHEVYINVGTTWQLERFPLSEFQAHGVDLTDLKALTFSFRGSGSPVEVDIDDISFIKPSQLSLPIIQKSPLTNLYLHNYTGDDVSYTVHGIGTKTVPDTWGGDRFFWGSFPVGTYNVSWHKISKPTCRNSGTRTYPAGDFEPLPMRCN